MKKLSLQDIRIVSEQEQLKTLIKNLGGVKSISKKIGLSESSIYKSFKRPSDVFKFKIMNLTQKNYGEVILSSEDQVKLFVDNIFTYSKYYGTEEDLETLKEIKNLSRNFFSLKRYIKIDRAIAIHHVVRGNLDIAIKLLNETLEAAKHHNFIDEQIFISCDLAYLELSSNRKCALKDILNIESKIQDLELNNYTNLMVYETLAMICNANNQFEKGLIAIEEAKKYCETEYQKAKLLFSEAFLRKRSCNFETALKLYSSAEEIFEEHNLYLDLRMVLNNKASIYKELGEYKTAINEVNKSMTLINGDSITNHLTTKANLLELKILSNQGDIDENISKFIDLIAHSYDKSVNESALNTELRRVLNLISKLNLINVIDAFESLIIKIIISKPSDDSSKIEKYKMLGELRVLKYTLSKQCS